MEKGEVLLSPEKKYFTKAIELMVMLLKKSQKSFQISK